MVADVATDASLVATPFIFSASISAKTVFGQKRWRPIARAVATATDGASLAELREALTIPVSISDNVWSSARSSDGFPCFTSCYG